MTSFKQYDLNDGYYLVDTEVLPNTRWVVVWYESHSEYEGSGTIVAKVGRGEYYWADLGHCSCFGPLDEPDDAWGKIGDYRALLRALEFDESIKGRRRDPKDADYKMYMDILRQVRKIHRQERRALERRRARKAARDAAV
jgi:hypothetical protein